MCVKFTWLFFSCLLFSIRFASEFLIWFSCCCFHFFSFFWFRSYANSNRIENACEHHHHHRKLWLLCLCFGRSKTDLIQYSIKIHFISFRALLLFRLSFGFRYFGWDFHFDLFLLIFRPFEFCGRIKNDRREKHQHICVYIRMVFRPFDMYI